MNRCLRRWILLAGLMAMHAADDASAMSCIIYNAPQFTFGEYDPHAPLPLDVQSSFSVQCTPAFRGETMNLRISFAGIVGGQLSMRNAATGDLLRFNMYKDPARAQPIDAQSVLVYSMPLLTTTTLSLPIFGRVPARQNVAVGHYQLPVTVIVNF